MIYPFDYGRRSDLANERLPDFETARLTIFPMAMMIELFWRNCGERLREGVKQLNLR